MLYKVIESYDKDRLEKEVMKAIQDGWKPLGGISISMIVNNRETRYAQAVTCNNMSKANQAV